MGRLGSLRSVALDETRGLSARRAVFLTALLVAGIVLGASFGYLWKHNRVQAESTPAPSGTQESTEGAMEKQVFESKLAGRWYAAGKEALNQQIQACIDKAQGAPMDHVIALLLPHAGYEYSGPTAAYGLRALAGKHYDRVIVMGPTHRVGMRNTASVPRGVTHYATPLGEVPLDVEFIHALLSQREFRNVPEAHADEHSVQIELPLLQKVLGDFKFVPIVVGQLDAATARRMAETLRGLIDANTLVVASSDFTHYGDYFDFVPFKDNIAANLDKLDRGAWDLVAKKDLDGFIKYVDDTGATICGRCPISILLAMLPKDAEPHLLHYETSGAQSNDFSHSVSYVCAAFTGAWPEGKQAAANMDNASALSEDDKKALLTLARRTLEYVTAHDGDVPTLKALGLTATPGMQQVMGAFVTLKEHGQLRGCIGEIIPTRPVYEAVIAQAANAALNDPRFPAVEAKEVPDIDIEISAYPSAPIPVASYKDIVLGKHGMLIEKNGRRALFLPQVAPEQGWDLPETLTHLSMKAGLSADAWKEGASFSVFEATVFGEKE